jgi:excisionase family DNA binding protein
MDLAPLLTIPQVAKVLNTSEWTVRAWIRQGRLVSVKLGHLRRVHQSEVRRVVEHGLRTRS